MTPWTLITMLAAGLVFVRMVQFVNLMHVRSVPQYVAVTVCAMGVGAILYVLAPFWGESYSWRDAFFAAVVSVYVWIDRRSPVSGRVAT